MHHHRHITQWIIIGLLGIVVLSGLALWTIRPAALSQLPLFAPTPTPTPIASQNIIITNPHSDEYVTQKFTVVGKARVFENSVQIRVTDKLSGQTYIRGTTMTIAREAGTFGDFTATITITDTSIPPGTKLVLEVFQQSPKDGSERDKVTIPLIFTPSGE